MDNFKFIGPPSGLSRQFRAYKRRFRFINSIKSLGKTLDIASQRGSHTALKYEHSHFAGKI